MTTQGTTFTEHHGIDAGPELTDIVISAFVDPADHFQVVIQDLIKVLIFLSGLCQDHRQMERDCTQIKAADKHRFVIVISRRHAASFIPGSQEGPAAHRRNHPAIFLIHICDVSFSG